MNILLHNIQRTLLIFTLLFLLQACGGGSSSSNREDTSAGTVTLTSLNSGEEIIGTTTITWNNDEPNRSYVDIELSSDSGTTFNPIENRVADTGSYSWDSNTAKDCRNCRVRITATDVVGNVTDPVESTVDFIINNVPQVLGSALYRDLGNNGLNAGDTITIPFDKPIELNASVAGDAFFVPVLGDDIGPFSTMKLGTDTNSLEITIKDIVDVQFHLHVSGKFDASKTIRTSPSGLDILDNIPGDIIFAKDTLRTAEPIGNGIDIAPTFNEYTPPDTILPASTVAVEFAYLDKDSIIDYITINTNGVNSLYSGTGETFFSQILLGNSSNTSVTTGDIDGDNNIDIIVGNSNGTFIYTNSGAASIMTLIGTLTDTNTQNVALLDIDGDLDLDLVMATNGGNQVWENNAVNSGNFINTSQSLGSNNSTDLSYADIDKDGDLDLVYANNGQSNRVYLNNGSGTFTDSGQTLGNNDSYSVALGDVDADGDVDIVFGNKSGQANQLYLNNGTGVFTSTNQSLGNDFTVAIALIDFDGDKDLDIVTANDSRPNRVWFNKSDGTFIDSGQLIQAAGTNGATTDIALSDLDSDGDLDLLEGKDAGIVDIVWKNSSKFKVDFVDSSQRLGTNDTRSIAIEDLNGDGFLDIFSANYNQSNKVWFADEKIKYTESNQILGDAPSTTVVLGDIDSDGDIDAIVANKNQANIVWRNNGSGTFTSIQELGNFNTEGLVLGDIDADNDLDLVTANVGEANKVYRNNGSGVFSEDAQQVGLNALTNDTYAVVLGDLNGDSNLDLVTGNSGQNNKVWYNDGSGIFVDASLDSDANTTRSLALKDLNGDGKLDIISGNAGQGNQINYGVGFVIRILSGTNVTTGIAAFDADKDGDIDILSVNNIQPNNLTLGESFTSPLTIAGSEAFKTTSIAVADLDSDGDLDFVTGNSGVESNRIWLNDN